MQEAHLFEIDIKAFSVPDPIDGRAAALAAALATPAPGSAPGSAAITNAEKVAAARALQRQKREAEARVLFTTAIFLRRNMFARELGLIADVTSSHRGVPCCYGGPMCLDVASSGHSRHLLLYLGSVPVGYARWRRTQAGMAFEHDATSSASEAFAGSAPAASLAQGHIAAALRSNGNGAFADDAAARSAPIAVIDRLFVAPEYRREGTLFCRAPSAPPSGSTDALASSMQSNAPSSTNSFSGLADDANDTSATSASSTGDPTAAAPVRPFARRLCLGKRLLAACLADIAKDEEGRGVAAVAAIVPAIPPCNPIDDLLVNKAGFGRVGIEKGSQMMRLMPTDVMVLHAKQQQQRKSSSGSPTVAHHRAIELQSSVRVDTAQYLLHPSQLTSSIAALTSSLPASTAYDLVTESAVSCEADLRTRLPPLGDRLAVWTRYADARCAALAEQKQREADALEAVPTMASLLSGFASAAAAADGDDNMAAASGNGDGAGAAEGDNGANHDDGMDNGSSESESTAGAGTATHGIITKPAAATPQTGYAREVAQGIEVHDATDACGYAAWAAVLAKHGFQSVAGYGRCLSIVEAAANGAAVPVLQADSAHFRGATEVTAHSLSIKLDACFKDMLASGIPGWTTDRIARIKAGRSVHKLKVNLGGVDDQLSVEVIEKQRVSGGKRAPER